jgi:hypothetical protein
MFAADAHMGAGVLEVNMVAIVSKIIVLPRALLATPV